MKHDLFKISLEVLQHLFCLLHSLLIAVLVVYVLHSDCKCKILFGKYVFTYWNVGSEAEIVNIAPVKLGLVTLITD